ncbi:MAG TPA: thermonuclease family protein [Burkholderiales bacterium]|nr:thermonuclease family protein [Burkholderiales bacterium]
MPPYARPLTRLLRAAARIALLAVLTLPSPSRAGSFAAKVVVVVDGDTVVVRDDRARRHEIRIAGIDAPEIRQPYGVRSRSYLAELLYGRQVTVAWYKRDRYNRVLGRVFVTLSEPCGTTLCARPVDAGYAQIAAGLAWHDKEHLDEQPAEERLRYGRAEQEARLRHAGLWAESAPIPPWRYRHLHPRRLSERMPLR